MKTLLTATAVLSLAAAVAAPATAQTRHSAAGAKSAAAPPAAGPAASAGALSTATPLVSGPPLPGVCVFSFDRALGLSAAGKAAATRLQQLGAQVQAELQPEQTALQNDIKAFDSQKATLPADQVQSRGQALQARITGYDQKAQLRQQELQVTSRKAQARIGQEVEPLLRSVYQARSCSLLLNGDSVLGANPAMDLSEAVVVQLNAKLPTISFDREHLDQQAPAAR